MPTENELRYLLREIAKGPSKEWRENAYCIKAEIPTSVFFPEGSRRSPFTVDWSQPRDACRRCEVESECLAYALSINETRWGMYGGKTPDERAALMGKKPRSTSGRALQQAVKKMCS